MIILGSNNCKRNFTGRKFFTGKLDPDDELRSHGCRYVMETFGQVWKVYSYLIRSGQELLGRSRYLQRECGTEGEGCGVKAKDMHWRTSHFEGSLGRNSCCKQYCMRRLNQLFHHLLDLMKCHLSPPHRVFASSRLDRPPTFRCGNSIARQNILPSSAANVSHHVWKWMGKQRKSTKPSSNPYGSSLTDANFVVPPVFHCNAWQQFPCVLITVLVGAEGFDKSDAIEITLALNNESFSKILKMFH
jgi:hypothetical protein